MGYTTEFEGQFALDKPLKPEHSAYLHQFSETRRMKRDPKIAATFPDPIREAAKLPIGIDGGYFVGGKGTAGQDEDKSVLNYNYSSKDQPGLWCQWVPASNDKGIEWDGGEKFYDYEEWLIYLIDNFLQPWGYILNGKVKWRGEDFSDMGTITVKNNKVTTKAAKF